jgi:outer membrane lipoprotein-sorting protein
MGGPLAAAEDEKSQQIIECLRTEYGDLPGLSVDYERTIQTASMALLGGSGTKDLATGTIYFMPPHFLKIEQKAPKIETVTANGETLWWYVPQDKKIHKYSSKEVGRELRIFADIFQGLQQVESSFKVLWEGHTEKGDAKLTLVPDPPWAQTHHISLSVTSGCRLREVAIHNTAGNVTRFVLSGLEPRESFDKDFFTFSVPQGVKVIEE